MPSPAYGWEHQKARAKAIEMLVPGTKCRFCKRPMYAWQKLDYDHIIPVAKGGLNSPRVLTHSRCNRSAGAKMGNRNRRSRGIRRATKRRGNSGSGGPRKLPSW